MTLAIGSTNPGILAIFIDKFSQVFPDYRDRVLRHEAAHFLVGYLLGVPALGYDLAIGREHTDFAEAKLQKRLFQSDLSAGDIDQLSVVAMAGVAAEAMEYDEACCTFSFLHTASLFCKLKVCWRIEMFIVAKRTCRMHALAVMVFFWLPGALCAQLLVIL